MPRTDTVGSVLVVEDDAELVLALKERIEELGYRAPSAPNGLEALVLLESAAPSLMLVDLFIR